ncbi:MAG: PAC2 family protein [Candidatus Omnitrophica bacterium]|nr:PAC2 family protein [Candidatus Omnitrophota bacterium]
MEKIKFFKKPRLKDPIMIALWPGMGEVAYKTGLYLIEHLKFERFATFSGSDYFPLQGSIIKEGIISLDEPPFNNFYFWKDKTNKKNDIILFMSKTQPDPMRSKDYTDKILEVAKYYKVKLIISIAAMPAPIDHVQASRVWFSVTDKQLSAKLRQFDLKMMNTGQISGMNGLFLALGKLQGFMGFCLLGEIPFYTVHMENPKATLAVLEKLKELFNLPLNLKPLETQAQFIEREINKLVDYIKEGLEIPSGSSFGSGPINQEDIQELKKALGEFSKLPQSARSRIEELFASAKKDVSKANQLKQELDKWNVYKEYEDKFLDLFRKTKGKLH